MTACTPCVIVRKCAKIELPMNIKHMYIIVGFAAPETNISIFLFKDNFSLNVNRAQMTASMHEKRGKSSVLAESICGNSLLSRKNVEIKIKNGVN